MSASYVPEPTVADTEALQCMSGSGAFVADIVAKDALPNAFRSDDFKHFQIAGSKKINIDVLTGQYATGLVAERMTYSYDELTRLGDIPNAKYLQFIPDGTPYSVLDFDTDKSLSDEERHRQVNYITDTMLKQFEGKIEYSASHLGVHAYIEDKVLNGMDLKKTLKISNQIPDVGKIDLEVFNSSSPITLTFNYIDDSIADFDTVPKKIMVSLAKKAKEEPAPNTEKKNIDLTLLTFDDSEVSEEVLSYFRNLDKKNQIQNGYPKNINCSDVDLYMTSLAAKAGFTQNQAYTFMIGWMTTHRPKSTHPITTMEITNKARRAVAYAFKTGTSNNLEEQSTSGDDEKEKVLTLSGINIKIDEMFAKDGKVNADDFMTFISKQKQLYITPKTFTPVEGTDLFFNGATHMIIAPSKEGKTTLVIDEAAKTDKRIIMLDGDGNGSDAIAQAGENTKWLQPISPDSFLDTILHSIDKANTDYSGYIFIIDSLKNFRNKISVDGNDASDIVDRIKKLTATGGTVVILHHITGTTDGKVKMKGNEEAILSSCDITYTYDRKNGLSCYKSRIKGVLNGQSMTSTVEEPSRNLLSQMEKI